MGDATNSTGFNVAMLTTLTPNEKAAKAPIVSGMAWCLYQAFVRFWDVMESDPYSVAANRSIAIRATNLEMN
ncbi:unnamed protein product, partial [Aphanomyces euteiches]